MFVFQTTVGFVPVALANSEALALMDKLALALEGKKGTLAPALANGVKSKLDASTPAEWKTALDSISQKAKGGNFEAALNEATSLKNRMLAGVPANTDTIPAKSTIPTGPDTSASNADTSATIPKWKKTEPKEPSPVLPYITSTLLKSASASIKSAGEEIAAGDKARAQDGIATRDSEAAALEHYRAASKLYSNALNYYNRALTYAGFQSQESGQIKDIKTEIANAREAISVLGARLEAAPPQTAKPAAKKTDNRILSPLTAGNFAAAVEEGIKPLAGYGVTTEKVQKELTTMVIYANKFLVPADEAILGKKDAATNLQFLRNSKLTESQMRTTTELALISSWVGATNARSFIISLGKNFTFEENGTFTRKSDSKSLSLLEIMKDNALLLEIGAPAMVIKYRQRLENSLIAFEAKAQPVQQAKLPESKIIPGAYRKLWDPEGKYLKMGGATEAPTEAQPTNPSVQKQFGAAKERISALANPIGLSSQLLETDGTLSAEGRRMLSDGGFISQNKMAADDISGKSTSARVKWLATKQALPTLLDSGAIQKAQQVSDGVRNVYTYAPTEAASGTESYSNLTSNQKNKLAKALETAETKISWGAKTGALYDGKEGERPIDHLIKIAAELELKNPGA